MDDRKKYDKALVGIKIFHGFIMIATTLIIILACISVYLHVRDPATQKEESLVEAGIEEGKGQTKPLPDYMIKNIKPDELGYLKP